MVPGESSLQAEGGGGNFRRMKAPTASFCSSHTLNSMGRRYERQWYSTAMTRPKTITQAKSPMSRPQTVLIMAPKLFLRTESIQCMESSGGTADARRLAGKLSTYWTPGILYTPRSAGMRSVRLKPDSSRNSRDHTYGVSYAGALLFTVVATAALVVAVEKTFLTMWET